MFRVVRISRLFKLVNKYKGFEALLSVVQYAIPQLLNVLLLMMIFMFIFAVLGVYLFRGITEGEIDINEFHNFKNFGFALMLCLRMITGENWPDIMSDTMLTSVDGCIEGVNCGNKLNWIYFVVYTLFMMNIIMQLFILVILEEFDKNYGGSEEGALSKFKSDLE